MDNPNPWSGRCVRHSRDTWTFAADGRSAVLDTGRHVTTVKLRAVKAGWLVTSRPISFVFLNDGRRMRTRIAGAVVAEHEMEDVSVG